MDYCRLYRKHKIYILNELDVKNLILSFTSSFEDLSTDSSSDVLQLGRLECRYNREWTDSLQCK